MTASQLLDNIILHENAYFYIKETSGFLSKRIIKETFSEAATDKHGRSLLEIVKEKKTLSNGIEIFYSILVFKYIKKPSFTEELITNWEEVKLAYMCIVDFEEHLVVTRRNISKISDFLKTFEALDYNVITSIYSQDNTSFEKLSMDNMNISDRAIRQKSLESPDLKENVSSFGLQGYILNTVRVSNDEEKIALSVNSSRINQLGPKNTFNAFLNWCNKTVEKIKNYVPKTNFLSSFATSIDYSKHKDDLTPTSILIILSKIYKEFEENKIKRCFFRIKKRNEILEREINLIPILKQFEYLLEIEEIEDVYKIKNNVVNDLFLFLNNKSITLRSKKLSKLFIEYETDLCYPILSVINWTRSYIITFDNPEFIYCNRKLFKDSRLLGNLDSVLKIFKENPELENVTSEKGKFRVNLTNFETNSVFGFVENTFKANYEYFICDDLSKEWADHIGLNEDSIAFYHSKYKNSNFSASDFQDIIGQALKNLGNLSPSDDQWEIKERLWNNLYKNDFVETQISRIRTGQSSNQTISYFKTIKGYPNIKKQVHIVINFISKSALEDRLHKLKNGESFQERNEVIQILWFISSLISSCFEANTEVYIHCKP
ncbi:MULTISPECIES: hypothetical protein [Chryseobacterium]|uniref:hypothetical protein n=1 Tax=Chryseobacterium TaxID=59732 RepID=UPI002222A920|nr:MULTISPECIES: hypothetical protein [Chryseobacterium]MCW1961490.1 hypothetical protein [Chryseobacterium viscerum]MDC8099479.1 hypothetical protein [Chryseobacterium rhizosphaerae]WPO92641.1 hypothetical protein SFA27_08060 [Chryseobacterium sp. HR92]